MQPIHLHSIAIVTFKALTSLATLLAQHLFLSIAAVSWDVLAAWQRSAAQSSSRHTVYPVSHPAGPACVAGSHVVHFSHQVCGWCWRVATATVLGTIQTGEVKGEAFICLHDVMHACVAPQIPSMAPALVQNRSSSSSFNSSSLS